MKGLRPTVSVSDVEIPSMLGGPLAQNGCLLAMSLGEIVARNIRRLRLERRLTQEVLAVDAGIDRTYVSRLERGLENPTVAVLEKLAGALSSNIEDLFRAPRPAEAPSRSPA